MRTKLFPLLVVCLVCFFSATAQTLVESESSITFDEKNAEIRLVLENPNDASERLVELEILDAQDVVRARAARDLRIKKGKEIYKITIPVGDLAQSAANGIDWFRLRYRIAGQTGIISLSQLLKDIFELRIAAVERIYAGTNYQVRVRAVQPLTNAAVEKVKIESTLEIERETETDEDEIELKANGETDGEGFAVITFKIPENIVIEDADVTVKGRKNGVFRDIHEDLNTNEDGGRILLTTDKPMYQPGQDFKVRGLYFDQNNTVVTGAELEFKIFDEDDTVLYKEKITTSAFGIAAVAWRIPDNAKLGSYRVEVDAKKDLSEDRLYFKVSRYDLPNFAVTAKPDKTFYLPSDKRAEISVTADYLFGKPVTKGKVRVVEESERRWNWQAQKYDVVEKGVFEGETDKDGKYVAKVDLNDEFSDLNGYGYNRFRDLHFSAYYTDTTTNRTEQRRFDVRISREPIHVYLVGRRYRLSHKLPIVTYVSTFYADGTPAACTVEVAGKNDDDDRDEYKTLLRLKTNAFGAGKLEFERPKNFDANDDLDLKITARDQDGKTGTHEEEIDYYDERDGLQIAAEKTIFKAGESIEINVVSSKKSGYVYVDVVKDWTAVASYLVELKDGKAALKIPYNRAFRGELTLAAYSDERENYYDDAHRDSRGVIFPTQENLQIEAKFEKTVFKPNEDAKISFTSLDGAGNPIETALGLVIFDKAIEERARTDADFGSYFSRYSSLLGYSKSFGAVTLKNLNDLDLSKPIAKEMQLVAEVMLADNYFYPRIYHSRFNQTEAKNIYAESFKKQFAPIEAALKAQSEKTGEAPFDEATLKSILSRNNLNFDEIRDVWGKVYRTVFTTDKTQAFLTWKSSGADKIFDTKDDFDVSTQTFAYFQSVGEAINRAAENYHKAKGGFIRDRATLRAELAKQNVDLDRLKDRWNRDYQIYFEVSGRYFVIRFYSYGANGIHQTTDWNRDDFEVWRTAQDYFYPVERRITEIFASTVNAGKKPFPRSDEEFKNILRENDLDFANIKDGFGNPVYLSYNKFSRYADKTIIEKGKQKITPVTEEVVNFNIQSDGANRYDLNDNAILASFSGVVVEQSNNTEYQKKAVKTIAFAGEGGAIRGTVTDATGAVIPGASIIATDVSNSGKAFTATTDDNGEFVLANLPPSKYNLRIDVVGFKSFLYQEMEIRAQIAVEIRATMEAGAVSAVVEVSSESVSINASSSQVQTTITARQVTELPVNGRNLSNLALLKPGVAGKDNQSSPPEENSTPRLREYFPETLLWNPEVITDVKGRAEVKFKLADNITTWKLYTIASTKNGKVGIAEKEIQAFQPFFVDLEPPKFLTEGDEIHLPTQIRNYTDKRQKVNVSMAKSDWFSFLGADKQSIEVASGASENAVFGFKTVSSIAGGKQKVTAIAATDSDAIEKPVTVRPNGQEIVRTETKLFSNSAAFDVDFPANALAKTPKAELKIYPNLMAHVTESVEGLLQRPYGCGEQTISSTYPNLMILKFAKSDANVKKLALKFTQKGYERLLGYQVASGGFSYWGGKDEADIALTAYALRFLNDAKSFIAVDEAAVVKAENWLAAQQRADGSFTKKYYYETTEDSSRTKLFTSYVARTLAMSKDESDAVLSKALAYLKTQNARIDEPYALALFGLASLDAGNTEDARAIAETLARIAIPENNAVYWKLETNTPFYGWGTAGRVETTALVVQLLIRIQDSEFRIQDSKIQDLIAKGTQFLLKNKDRYGVWYSTQTTINVLDAFLAALSGETPTAQNQQINVALNGADVQTISIASDQVAPLIIELNGKIGAGANRLEITNSSKAAVMAQIVQSHYIDWKDSEFSAANANQSRQLQLDYKCDKQTAQIMETVNCSVKAERVGFKGYGMLLAEIGIPPGADVSRESLQAAMDADWSLSRYDILPDRIVVYMWSKAGGTNLNFKFKPRYGINANTPASFAYDYYNEEAKAMLAPMKFEVK